MQKEIKRPEEWPEIPRLTLPISIAGMIVQTVALFEGHSSERGCYAKTVVSTFNPRKQLWHRSECQKEKNASAQVNKLSCGAHSLFFS